MSNHPCGYAGYVLNCVKYVLCGNGGNVAVTTMKQLRPKLALARTSPPERSDMNMLPQTTFARKVVQWIPVLLSR